MAGPKKSLGQHWLKDRDVLAAIADAATITPDDTVLEIGPGLGTLTSILLKRAAKVVAVEIDGSLAEKLPAQFPGTSLEVINQDILTFDLRTLPENYVVVANVPYYITSKIIQLLTTAVNKPRTIVLLIQKEVAERLAAKPGDMSILAVSAQVYADVSLGDIVPAELFTPPPKVDSQVVILTMRPHPLVLADDDKAFFRVVKAGFSAKRKKLRSSIASGLRIGKTDAEGLLKEARINPEDRAEQLSIDDWLRLTTTIGQRD
ncbi:MAG TPA: 16S rRNA (adenine(1518)-N(6)/adenine(1519)-N(6))-dimethyltransferase RsmA [Dongiaceae bacterium]|nr:16S rRNA (adenine(1518)-N(6)/adenine(1519)-N(6))-dimethyltransferase RsmA [Dongiaceae bacterium]